MALLEATSAAMFPKSRVTMLFPRTLEKLKYELLAYEGAPRVIRWGGCEGLLHIELEGTVSEEWQRRK